MVVRVVGIEPTLCHQNWISSPARLPVPPHPHKAASLVALQLRRDSSAALNRALSATTPSITSGGLGTLVPEIVYSAASFTGAGPARNCS